MRGNRGEGEGGEIAGRHCCMPEGGGWVLVQRWQGPLSRPLGGARGRRENLDSFASILFLMIFHFSLFEPICFCSSIPVSYLIFFCSDVPHRDSIGSATLSLSLSVCVGTLPNRLR